MHGLLVVGRRRSAALSNWLCSMANDRQALVFGAGAFAQNGCQDFLGTRRRTVEHDGTGAVGSTFHGSYVSFTHSAAYDCDVLARHVGKSITPFLVEGLVDE